MGGRKTVGVLHNEAFEFLKKNYKQLWVISLALFGVEMVLGIAVSIFVVPFQFFAGFFPAMFESNGVSLQALLPMAGIFAILFAGIMVLSFAVSIAQYASYIGGYDATIRLLGGGSPTFEAVWQNFGRNWKRFVGIIAWSMLWEFLWSLLFIVPGIVKSYSYKLAPFLVIQYPDMTVRQALRKSIEMTNGYKGRLFALDVILVLYTLASVLGLCLLVVGTVAIELLWLTPMMLLLYTIAYLDIKQAAIDNGLLPPDPIPPVEALPPATPSDESAQPSESAGGNCPATAAQPADAAGIGASVQASMDAEKPALAGVSEEAASQGPFAGLEDDSPEL